MKKFSINFLKVIFLLIVGVCMLGVISQVYAAERVKADSIIKEDKMELVKGETRAFTYAFDVVKVDGKIHMKLNEDYILPGELLTNESTTTIKSKSTRIATVDDTGRITAKSNGNTKIVCEVAVKLEGKDMVFYDEVAVTVADLNDMAKKVKANSIIEEEQIELKKGETKAFTYAFDVVKVDGEIHMKLNEDYILPGELLTHKSTTTIKSESTRIAEVDDTGRITAKSNGRTKIVCEVTINLEGEYMIFYDEVIVVVRDLNDEADDSAADLPGLEGFDFGETANGIISVVEMLLGWLGEILASINWAEVGDAVMGMLSGITNN